MVYLSAQDYSEDLTSRAGRNSNALQRLVFAVVWMPGVSSDDAILPVMPADHVIKDTSAFQAKEKIREIDGMHGGEMSAYH